jgi:hypothetical protein
LPKNPCSNALLVDSEVLRMVGEDVLKQRDILAGQRFRLGWFDLRGGGQVGNRHFDASGGSMSIDESEMHSIRRKKLPSVSVRRRFGVDVMRSRGAY